MKGWEVNKTALRFSWGTVPTRLISGGQRGSRRRVTAARVTAARVRAARVTAARATAARVTATSHGNWETIVLDLKPSWNTSILSADIGWNRNLAPAGTGSVVFQIQSYQKVSILSAQADWSSESRQPEWQQPELQQPESRQPEWQQPDLRQPESRQSKSRQPKTRKSGAFNIYKFPVDCPWWLLLVIDYD